MVSAGFSNLNNSRILWFQDWTCPAPEGLEERLCRNLPGLGEGHRCPAVAIIYLKTSAWAGKELWPGLGVWCPACWDSPLNAQGWQRAGSIFLSEYPLIS